MRKFMTAALMAASLAGSLGLASSASAQDWNSRHGWEARHWDNRGDRGWDRQHYDRSWEARRDWEWRHDRGRRDWDHHHDDRYRDHGRWDRY